MDREANDPRHSDCTLDTLPVIIFPLDCSFVRLSRICRVLGFKVSDILDANENAESKRIQFTADQPRFFLNNMRSFRFFVKLAVERQSIESIREEFRVSEEEAFAVLKKLDDIRLIQLHPENKIKLPSLKLVKNFGTGPLLEKLYLDSGREIVSQILHPFVQKTRGLSERSAFAETFTRR